MNGFKEMNRNELAAQLQFFKDIGVESLAVGAVGEAQPRERAASSGEAQARERAASSGEAQARERAASSGEAQARERAASSGEAQARERAASSNDRPLGAHSAALQDLESVRAEIGDCQRCKLAPKR